MICLDTNVVIGCLRGRPPGLVERLERELPHDIFTIPVVVLFELQYGVARSTRRRDNEERLAVFLQLPIAVLPFEPDDAEEAGDIRATLERAGTPIGPYDILIAAQARRRNAVLVTDNLREFIRVPRLKTANWAAA
jgi:tRNA(fMet)-specific endonuclease VapC